jgi:hypothetical protein
MNNMINITLKSTNVNGWPCVRIKTIDQNFYSIDINQELTNFLFSIPTDQQNFTVLLERYGKTDINISQQLDQTVEITSVTVDDVEIPDFVLNQHSRFQFNDQTHIGSRYFSPNGLWTFEFKTPIITWILDQRIIHESQYNQDYVYPWSYKFGPESISTLSEQLDSVLDKVHKIL